MMKSEMDWRQLNGLALAYMGDAVFEKHVRYELLKQGAVKPNKLHKTATNYVSAKAQAYILHELYQQEFYQKRSKRLFVEDVMRNQIACPRIQI